MSKYAKIIVNVPINDNEKYFDYKVPKKLENQMEIGKLVSVPFGNRTIKDFVIYISKAI